MKRVLCAGEINVDLVLQGYTEFPVPGKEVLVQDFAMVLGSATAIMAMGLARLGTPVSFVGRVGDDVWGRYCLEDMAPPRHRPLPGRPRGRPEDGSHGLDHLAERPGARHLPGRDQRPDRRRRPRRGDGRPRPPARVVLLLPGGPAPGLPRSLRAGPPRRAHHVARHRLRPERPVGRRAPGDPARDRPLLPERGGARGAHRHRGSRGGPAPARERDARASWPSWGETGP